MGAGGQDKKVGELFAAADYEVSQADGPEVGVVDWFATPREGLSRPRTYFVAWERRPEELVGALAELERARVARQADKALGVVMAGGLPEGYQTDLGRVTEAITYRRLALEVSGVAERVREQVRRYEREQGPELYLPLRGQLESGEIVDVAAYIEEWASEEAADNLVVKGSERWSLPIPIRQAVYAIGMRFNLDPENVVPLVAHKYDDVSLPFESGFAIPVREDVRPASVTTRRALVYRQDRMVSIMDDHVYHGLEGRQIHVLRPSLSEFERWFRRHLDEQAHARFMSAREIEPAFGVLSAQWRNMRGLLVAMRAMPPTDRIDTVDWIVRVVSGYMASLAPATLDEVEAMAFGQYALGPDWDEIDPPPSPPEEWVDNWEAFDQGAALILNRLVRDYLLARRIAREVDLGRLEILTRHQFPEKYVILFLAVISPAAAARAAEIRAQIEGEVERRLQLTLAHQLKRSVGVLRSHVKTVRGALRAEDEARLAYELRRIDEELAHQSLLAERTGRLHDVPNGPDEGLSLSEVALSVVTPLQERHPSVRCEVVVPASILVRAKSSVLREILHCLVENAFHAAAFSGKGDPIVQISAREHEDTVVLDVIDNGPGVPVALREHIFEPYVTTKKGGDQPLGTGVGLTIARRYAERIGARVSLDGGREATCFSVRFIAWKGAS